MRAPAAMVVPIVDSFSAACAVQAYTPAARSLPMETVSQGPVGTTSMRASAAGLAVDAHGPAVALGEVGATHALREDVTVSADLGALRIGGDEGHAVSGGTFRLGAMSHGTEGPIAGGVFAGLGGGASRVGGWVSPDVGFVLNGTHRWVRPMLVFDGFASLPMATRRFSVLDDPGPDGGDGTSSTVLRLPRTIGAPAMLGVEVGTPALSVRAGFSAGAIAAAGTDVEEAHGASMIGFGLGLAGRL